MKFGIDVLNDNGDWEYLYNLPPMSIHDVYNWCCAMGGIIGKTKQWTAMRLVRLENGKSE